MSYDDLQRNQDTYNDRGQDMEDEWRDAKYAEVDALREAHQHLADALFIMETEISVGATNTERVREVKHQLLDEIHAINEMLQEAE